MKDRQAKLLNAGISQELAQIKEEMKKYCKYCGALLHEDDLADGVCELCK